MIRLRWWGIGGLFGMALFTVGNAWAESMRHLDYPSAALSFTRAAEEESRSKLPPEVAFSVSEPVRVEEGRWAVLAGELVNPLKRPVKVVVFAGNGDTPFSLWPLLGEGGGAVRWRQKRPGEVLFPPVPAPPFRMIIPARTAVRFSARFDLDLLEYSGEPDLDMEWRFGFRQRPDLVGQARLRLPAR